MVNTRTLSLGPYAVECTDALGRTVGVWYATDFGGLLDAYRTAREAHPEEGHAWEFANLDIAEAGYDGLTAEEREVLGLLGAR